MKTFFAFTTGLCVGAIGMVVAFLSDTDIQDEWNCLANFMNK